VNELIATGLEKLGNVPSVGGGAAVTAGAGPAAAAAPQAAPPPEEKVRNLVDLSIFSLLIFIEKFC